MKHPTGDYDKTSVASIVEFSRLLNNKTLSEACAEAEIPVKESNKGNLGILVEKYYFHHVPTSNHGPDFFEAGLELKTTGIKPRKSASGTVSAKERLVLTMINYNDICDEDWENSALLAKCRLMLILLYKYDRELAVTDRRFVLGSLLLEMDSHDFRTSSHDLEFIAENAMRIPMRDLKIIKDDWEIIRKKICDGKAHELSEGDTNYLAAARKGSGGMAERLKKQANADEPARGRAFAFKQGYMTTLLNGHATRNGIIPEGETMTLEDATSARFAPFLGMSVEEIASAVGIPLPTVQPKNFKRTLANRILESSGGSAIELVKAEIEMKTVLLGPRGRPQEDMSFPAFTYEEIANQEWDESEFSERIERKFLFVVYQRDVDGVVRLVKSTYWNMPHEDRREAQRVFEETRLRVMNGNHSLPAASESRVAHVRPKARNRKHLIPFPDGSLDVKKCFWLNKSYVAGVLETGAKS